MVEKIGYSIDEAVEASGIGRTTLYQLMGSGEIESIKVGRRRVIPADSIRAYFAARRAAAADHDRDVVKAS